MSGRIRIGLGSIIFLMLVIVGIIGVGMSATYYLGLWNTPVLLISMGSWLTFGVLFIFMLTGVVGLFMVSVWAINKASRSSRGRSKK